MHIIDGTRLAQEIHADVRAQAALLARPPKLAVLLVGADRASHLYVSMKKKRAEEAGILIECIIAPASATDAALIETVKGWNAREDIDGILVQIPLPPHHDEAAVTQAIDPRKDVDGFHPESVRALLAHEPSFVPPVHEGILRLIASTPLVVTGKTAVVIVNSTVFSAPLVHLLTAAGLFVHVMDPDTLDGQVLRRADVIVVAIGRSKFLHAGMTKKDVVVIDVGTNHDVHGVLCGDVDQATFAPYEAYISPVPGGVGPMTIALLLRQVIRSATNRQGIRYDRPETPLTHTDPR